MKEPTDIKAAQGRRIEMLERHFEACLLYQCPICYNYLYSIKERLEELRVKVLERRLLTLNRH